jgi:hypothetical protein
MSAVDVQGLDRLSDTPRVIICGGRDYNDREEMERAFEAWILPGDVIVHGGCRGADRLAEEIARERGLRAEPHPADWGRHGPMAGPIRNQEMVDAGASFVLAVKGGSGTQDCVRRAEAAGIRVLRVPTVMP